MRLKLVACVLALACSGPVYSQVQPDRGWYVGGSFGQAEADRWCQGTTGLTCDDNDTAWKLFGGYQINRHVGVEAGYTDLGEVSVSRAGPSISASSNVSANAYELVGIGRLPITSRFSVFGKFGWYRGEAEAGSSFSAPGFILAGSEKETNTDTTYGAGLMFDVTRSIVLRGEWQRYSDFGGGQVGGETDVDVMSLGVMIRF